MSVPFNSMRRSISAGSVPSSFNDPSIYYDTIDQWSSHRTPVRSRKLSIVSPETPMRDNRGRSGSYQSPMLITPQSASPPNHMCRSFSTPLVSYPFDKSLPTPLETPLNTPLGTPITPSLKMPFESSVYKKRFASNSSSISETLEDSHRNRSVSPTSNGVNPFYQPSAFVRKSISVERQEPEIDNLHVASPIAASVSYLEHSECSPLNETDESNVLLESTDLQAKQSTDPITNASISAAAAMAANPPYELEDFVADCHAPAYHVNDLSISESHFLDQHPKSNLNAGRLNQMPEANQMSVKQQLYGNAHMHSISTLYNPMMAPMSVMPPAMHAAQAMPQMEFSMQPPKEASPEDKRYVCETCYKGFRRVEHLKRHKKTHTNERPFACPIPDCGRKFSRNDNLKAHVLTHARKSSQDSYIKSLVDAHINQTPKRRKNSTQISI